MILFQKNDSKFRAIRAALDELNVSSSAVDGSPMSAPFVLLRLIVKKKKPNVYVFRYLNDYPSLLKSLLRFISEISVVLICKLFNIRIWWLCHNVDKETNSHYKRLSLLRRYIIKQNSKLIFTTHPLLIPHAELILGKRNIDSLSLGYLECAVYDTLVQDKTIESKLVSWIEERKTIKSKFIFVVGSVADKVHHFKNINSLIDILNKNDKNVDWYAVVIGERVEEHDNIFNVPSRYLLTPQIIKEHIDFYYRVIDDLSISYSLFEAAKYEKATITEGIGFLPEIIKEHNLGFVLDRNNILPFLEEVHANKYLDYSLFLENNNWEVTALTLKKYLYDSCS